MKEDSYLFDSKWVESLVNKYVRRGDLLGEMIGNRINENCKY